MLRGPEVCLGPNSQVSWVVGQPQAKLGVNLGLVSWVGLAQHSQQV